MGLPVRGGLGRLHGSAGHWLYRQPQCGPGLAQCARGGRKVRGRCREGGRKGVASARSSSCDVISRCFGSKKTVISRCHRRRERSVNSTFSVAKLLAGAGAGAGTEYLRIRGRSAGSSQIHKAPATPTAKLNFFFC